MNLSANASCSVSETSMGTAEEVIAEVSGLVSPPSVCVRLYNLIHSSHASAKDIGQTLELDPNLVARVLRIANSAAYSFPAQISCVARAVTILGTEDLCNLVMAIAAVRSFSKLNGGLYSIDDYWRHSVYVGLCSRYLAKRCKLADADSFFIAGLLHDVGIPVMYGNRPELSARIQPTHQQGEQSLVKIEREEFGFDHAFIGSELLSSWCLPEILIKAISSHHGPFNEPGGAILNIADHCIEAKESAGTNNIETALKQIDPGVWKSIGKSATELDIKAMLKQVDEEHESVLKALLG